MFLHSLFFPQYLPLSDFSNLEPYMFSEKVLWKENIESAKKEELIPKEIIKEEKEQEKPREEQEKPREEQEKTPTKEQEKPKEEQEKPKEQKKQFYVKNVQDELFWLVYVAIYGETEYYRNKYNYGKLEIQEKQKIAIKMTDAEFNKKMKWKWTKIQRIEMISDLTNTPRMPIAVLNAFATYHDCTFILVDMQKKVYIEYGNEESQKHIIFVKTKPAKNGTGSKKEYSLEMDSSCFLEKESYFQLEHYERPLKAISNYKKNELDAISTKLGLPVEEKASKQEVYDRIRLYLSDSAILHS